MTSRDFFKKYFLKVLLLLIVLQVGIITIFQNSNHQPEAVMDIEEVIEGRMLKINPLSNDVDKENQTLSIASFETTDNAEAHQVDQLLYYTPKQGFFGKDSIQYTISDGKKISKPTYISINVIENLPPKASDDAVSLYAGSYIPVSVLFNDKDNENDSLFVGDYSQPKNGILTKDGDTFYYTANENNAQCDSFQYSVNDWKSAGTKATVRIAIKSKTDPIYPWLLSDIGDMAFKGQLKRNGSQYLLTGSGGDIWWSKDAFAFMYQYVSGDFEISTKIDDINGKDRQSKSGIMIRENLGEGSSNVYLTLNKETGVSLSYRSSYYGRTSKLGKVADIKAPYWLKLKRENQTVTFYLSKDGKQWDEMTYEREINLPQYVMVGLVCCSHNNKITSTNTYSHVNLINN